MNTSSTAIRGEQVRSSPLRVWEANRDEETQNFTGTRSDEMDSCTAHYTSLAIQDKLEKVANIAC